MTVCKTVRASFKQKVLKEEMEKNAVTFNSLHTHTLLSSMRTSYEVR